MFQVSRLRPQFSRYPTSGVVLHVHKEYVPGRSEPEHASVSHLSSDGWFNFRSSARIQQFHLEFNGDFELVALEIDADAAGVR